MATATKPRALRLEQIRTDGGTQCRESIDDDTVQDYADQMDAGAEFPPVDVFHDGTDYWLADGFHRFGAARRAGRETIGCTTHKGSKRDALIFAAGANHAHGLRRTNADKRFAIKRVLAEFQSRSDRWIAEKCGVHPSTIGPHRKQLSDSDSSRTGKDGKTRKPPTPRAPKLTHESVPDEPTAPEATNWEQEEPEQENDMPPEAPADQDEDGPAEPSEIPARKVRRTRQVLSELGQVANSIEALIDGLIRDLRSEGETLNHKTAGDKLRFAKKLVMEAKGLI